MRNNTRTKSAHQGDIAAVFESERTYHLDKGANSVSHANFMASVAVSGLYREPECELDGSRLSGAVTLNAKAELQTRGGEFADLDSTLSALDAIKDAIVASKSATHQDRVRSALSEALGTGRTSADKRARRMMELKILRKSVGTVIKHRLPDDYPHLSVAYAETLLKIEVELAYLGKTWGGSMHIDNVVYLLPKHAARVGHDVLRDRFKTLLQRYHEMHLEAALAAVETERFVAPKLITGREIGHVHTIKDCHIKAYFPKGKHFIRAADRDAIDADRIRRGLKVRVKAKPKTRAEICLRASEQREMEALMDHYEVRRGTVYHWRSKDGGKTYLDRVEMMDDERRRGIMKHKADDELSPEMRADLMKHYNVTQAGIRQWKRRKQLAGKIAQYRRETALKLVA